MSWVRAHTPVADRHADHPRDGHPREPPRRLGEQWEHDVELHLDGQRPQHTVEAARCLGQQVVQEGGMQAPVGEPSDLGTDWAELTEHGAAHQQAEQVGRQDLDRPPGDVAAHRRQRSEPVHRLGMRIEQAKRADKEKQLNAEQAVVLHELQ